MPRPSYLSYEQAVKKLEYYCAYQDRCHSEVRTKLIKLGVYGDNLENVIAHLIQENFLNEERFAQSYARGKFNIKKWGRQKIRLRLIQKKVSTYCIKRGMAEIDEDLYLESMEQLILRKMGPKENWDFYLFQKAGKFVIGKGYEPHLVWKSIRLMQKSSKT